MTEKETLLIEIVFALHSYHSKGEMSDNAYNKLFTLYELISDDKESNILKTLRHIDVSKLKGHECYAKHVLLSMRDRLKRLDFSKASISEGRI